MCIADYESAMDISFSLNWTSAICAKTCHERIDFSDGHYKTLPCSWSIALLSMGNKENFLLAQLTVLRFQSKTRSTLKLIYNFVRSRDQGFQDAQTMKTEVQAFYIFSKKSMKSDGIELENVTKEKIKFMKDIPTENGGLSERQGQVEKYRILQPK